MKVTQTDVSTNRDEFEEGRHRDRRLQRYAACARGQRRTDCLARLPARLVIKLITYGLGIGFAITQHLLSLQSNVVVVARGRAVLDALAAQYSAYVEVVTADLGDAAMGQHAVNAALARWGRLDGLVVNHGVLEPVQRVADADVEEWRRAFDVNLFSAVALVRASDGAELDSKCEQECWLTSAHRPRPRSPRFESLEAALCSARRARRPRRLHHGDATERASAH